MNEPFKPQAYLLVGCPFSLKFLLFLSEARLLDRFTLIRIDPQGPQFEQQKAQLAAASGVKPTFPMVEIEPGIYKSDSDQLIEHYAKQHHIDAANLTALSWYKEGVFPTFIRLYKENMELKQKAQG